MPLPLSAFIRSAMLPIEEVSGPFGPGGVDEEDVLRGISFTSVTSWSIPTHSHHVHSPSPPVSPVMPASSPSPCPRTTRKSTLSAPSPDVPTHLLEILEPYRPSRVLPLLLRQSRMSLTVYITLTHPRVSDEHLLLIPLPLRQNGLINLVSGPLEPVFRRTVESGFHVVGHCLEGG